MKYTSGFEIMEHAQRIAEAGRAFAEEHLSLDAMVRYHHALLAQYAALFTASDRAQLTKGVPIKSSFVGEPSGLRIRTGYAAWADGKEHPANSRGEKHNYYDDRRHRSRA